MKAGVQPKARFETTSPTAILINQVVAKFIEDNPSQTLQSMAGQMGFNKASQQNMLTQVRAGRSRMPLARIPSFCQVANADAVAMMSTALCEYEPELTLALEQVYGIDIRSHAVIPDTQ